MKLTSKPRAGIQCWSDIGPTFGVSTCYDLLVWGLDYSSNLHLGFGFACPENVNANTYFTGASPFEVSELEVFKVNL